MFGHFAISFGSRGVNSNVFTFDIAAPPNLQLEVVEPPSFTSSNPLIPSPALVPCSYSTSGCLTTLSPLAVQPKVRVKSNGAPLEGAAVFAELVPQPGSRFTRFTRLRYFDLVEGIQSASLSPGSTTTTR
mmetsp:Transcript_30921/g.96201  ORF Transcript_30921/g.96201 Transcript_30921/m.96201 type:complete len:130 (+) Transcript_30921:108-497(+)